MSATHEKAVKTKAAAAKKEEEDESSKDEAAPNDTKSPSCSTPPAKGELKKYDGESSKDDAASNDTKCPLQSTSPSVTVSSIHQYPSLPTVPSTPTLNNSPAAPLPPTLIASAPEESITPVSTSPKLAEFRPSIITAEENEQPSSSVRALSPKPADKKMSSLKVIKNVPVKPKESIFETKHPNLHEDEPYRRNLLSPPRLSTLQEEADFPLPVPLPDAINNPPPTTRLVYVFYNNTTTESYSFTVPIPMTGRDLYDAVENRLTWVTNLNLYSVMKRTLIQNDDTISTETAFSLNPL